MDVFHVIICTPPPISLVFSLNLNFAVGTFLKHSQNVHIFSYNNGTALKVEGVGTEHSHRVSQVSLLQTVQQG